MYLFILIFPNHKFGALSLTIFAFIYGRKKMSRQIDYDNDDNDDNNDINDAIGLLSKSSDGKSLSSTADDKSNNNVDTWTETQTTKRKK